MNFKDRVFGTITSQAEAKIHEVIGKSLPFGHP